MLKIKHSNKFKKDYIKYKKGIDAIVDENLKSKCNKLLEKLIQELNYIDAIHSTNNKDIDPKKIRENIENSIELRKQLNKVIKDLNNA